jgi:Uma2 family endonuclease
MSALLTPPAAAQPVLMTAEEFFDRYEDGGYELVDGLLVEMPMPGGIHGKVCGNVGFELKLYLRSNPIGTTFCNDTFVRLRRNPDTMRGPDVCFVSFATLPAADVPAGPLTVIPELVIEVRSPSDSWPDMERRAADYLKAGVTVVVVVDPPTASATAFRTGGRQDAFAAADTLTIPDVLPGFAVAVGSLFA